MMKDNKRNHIKLGAFVITAFLLFVIAIYYIGRKQNIFGSNFTISSEFENVSGLQKGNNVLYNGITIGSVDDILIVNDSVIRVDMTIDNKVQPHIKSNAIASINTSGLVGNMVVNIRPGKGNAPYIKDNSIIKSTKQKNTSEIIDDMGLTALNLTELTQNLIDITNKMNNENGPMGLLISNEQVAEDLRYIIQYLKASSMQMNSTLSNLNHLSKGIINGEGNIGYLLKDNSLKDQVQTISDDLHHLIKEEIKPTINDLTKSAKDMNTITKELKALSLAINNDQNIIHSLTQDSTLSRQLEQTIYNLQEGTKKFEESMDAIQQSWLGKKLIKN